MVSAVDGISLFVQGSETGPAPFGGFLLKDKPRNLLEIFQDVEINSVDFTRNLS